MTTTDTTLLIILTVLMSIFYILLITATIIAIKLLSSAKRVATKAEILVDTVETAAETFKDAGGKLTILRIMKNVMDLGRRGRKG